MTERYIQPFIENTPLIITQDFVNILNELSTQNIALTKEQREHRYLKEQELYELARSQHQGSEFLDEHIPQRLNHLLHARSNGHASIAIQDELGIQLPEDPAIKEARVKKLMAYGLPDTQENQTHEISLGIFSEEGAKTFELDHLIRIEPGHISQAISSGNIKKAEDIQKSLKEWDSAFYRKYNESYFREHNLYSILKTPQRVQTWQESRNIPTYSTSI